MTNRPPSEAVTADTVVLALTDFDFDELESYMIANHLLERFVMVRKTR